MFKLSQIIIKSSKTNGRLSSLLRLNSFATSPSVAEIGVQSKSDQNSISKTSRTKMVTNTKVQSNMVAAAFASLHSDESIEIKTPFTDEKIKKAATVDELLSISEGTGVSRKHALKVVSILADWSTSGKVKLSEFETDPRFVRLCRILTKGNSASIVKNNRNSMSSRSEDLSTILSVTADDEAAKLVGSITLPQMVKVMSTLSQKKRRSTLLLRALSYNITACSDSLDLKQCGDLLFSMSTLNFPDENLLARVSNDIFLELEGDIKKSAAIGSIITSIGLLRYKNPGLLDTLSEWVLKNHTLCRPQDIFSLFMTLAVLNYSPSNSEKLYEVILPQLTSSEAGKPTVWLEIVWSLMLLNQANPEQISSVLEESFINSLEQTNSLGTSTKLKLLNIDAAAQYLIKDYNGPRLAPTSNLRNTKMTQTRERTAMVDAIIDSLRNLIQTENHIRTRINTGHGFFIDAECVLDKKCNPLPLVDVKEDGVRIAILAYDYHDMCRGRVEPTGINVFASKLLEAQNYKTLIVPYTDFKPRDKIVHRVQYLELKLKEIIKKC